MPLVAREPEGSGGFKLPPEGTHLAICNLVVDLGLQETPFVDRDGNKTIQHKCYVRWELPEERIGEEPMTIGKFYTVSLHEAAILRQDLEGWRGKAFTIQEAKGFDIFKLLGHGCQITVVYGTKGNGQPSAKVTSVVGWPKGMPRKAAEIGLLKYSDDEPEQLADLPGFLKAILDKRVSQKPVAAPPTPQKAVDDLADEIPF